MLAERSYQQPLTSVSGETQRRESRIYLFPATVALFLWLLALGDGVAWTLELHRFYRYGPSYGLGGMSFWVALAASAAGALWLGHRLRLQGRLVAAGGMALLGVLLATPLLRDGTGTLTGEMLVLGGIVGVAFGFLFPMAFWRQVPRLSRGRKAFLAIAVLWGVLTLVFLIPEGASFFGSWLVVGFLALWVGLPLAWRQPVVGTPGRRVSGWFWVYLVLSFLAIAGAMFVLFSVAMSGFSIC